MIIIFEIIEIVLLQVFLVIFIKVNRQNRVNLSFYIFSWLIFGLIRISGEYSLLRKIIQESLLPEIPILTVAFYEFIYIILITLASLFIFTLLNKILFKKSAFYFASFIIWSSIFLLGIAPFIDFLIAQFGITPYITVPFFPFIGKGVPCLLRFGMIFSYLFLTVMIVGGGFYFRYKSKFENNFQKRQQKFLRVKVYIKPGLLIGLLMVIWILFIIVFEYSMTIVGEITLLFNFKVGNITTVHPFWLLAIIYGFLTFVPLYIGYLLWIFIKNRGMVWEYANSFNQLPIFNLGILVFSSFLVGYYELEYAQTTFLSIYLYRAFILFIIYFYLVIYLFLLFLYLLTFQKRSFVDIKFWIRTMLLYIPFLLGYLLAGLILTPTEFIFGILACATLQIFVIYWRSTKIYSFEFKYLNWSVIFAMGCLSISFAGLLSISGLVNVLIFLGLFLILDKYYLHSKIRIIFYGLMSANIILLGGTSSTFLREIWAIGLPNTIIFIITLLWVIVSIYYYYVKQ